MGAIGIVLQTKIFIDLKQTLLLRDGFREVRPARIAPEEASGASFETSIRETGREFFVGRPNVAAFGKKVGEKNVGQNVGDALVADDGHFLRSGLGRERVMKAPERVAQAEEKIVSCFCVSPREGFEEPGPLVGKNGESAETPRRMIQGAGSAEPPEFCGQNEPLHCVAMRPPTIPEIADIAASFVAIGGEIGRGEKTGDAKQDRFEVVRLFPERCERQSLSEERECEFVLFVTERRGYLLEQCRVASVIFDDASDACGLALETKLRSCREDVFEASLRQIVQRCLATARPRERDGCGKLIGQRRGIDPDLRHVPVRFCAGKKNAIALLDEDMNDRVVKRGVGGMAVRLPISIREIELDRTADWFAAVDPDGGVRKIWTGFAVPGAELNDLDFVPGDGSEAASEIAGEPARLKFQFAWRP